jgi:SOS-response transcriptional repressor LexA
VVLIDDEATLKHIYHIPNGLQLVSKNVGKYPPMVFTFPECDTIRILGRVVAYKRRL